MTIYCEEYALDNNFVHTNIQKIFVPDLSKLKYRDPKFYDKQQTIHVNKIIVESECTVFTMPYILLTR